LCVSEKSERDDFYPFGNRLNQIVGGNADVPMPSSSTASYTAASNQVSSSSQNNGAGFLYDAAGDVTYDGLNQYLYDAEGRLCAAKTAGPSLTGYVYDAAGTRVAKGSLTSFSCNFAANGFTPTASYVLGPGGEQVTEYSVICGAGTSNLANDWCHTNAFSGGKIQATYDGTDTTFYLGDWLGTKRVEFGASGCATAYASLAYGDSLTTVSLPGYNACAGDATEHHFTQKERDNESGNDYFEARYYASSMGRFMSPDWSAKEEPIPYAQMGDPQSLNLYAYVRNNPIIHVDLDGHQNPCNPNDWGCNSWSPNSAQSNALRAAQQPAQQQNASGNAVQKPQWFSLSPNTIVNFTGTTSAPTEFLGAAIGGSIGGPDGAVIGTALGSMFGTGSSISYVPSTDSTYIGPTLTFTPKLNGGNGLSLSAERPIHDVDANCIVHQFSFSAQSQPLWFGGVAGTWSPGNGAAYGASVGNRSPFTIGASYSFDISSWVRPVERWVRSLFQ
jgi:RHS repeat-associated protein